MCHYDGKDFLGFAGKGFNGHTYTCKVIEYFPEFKN